MVVHICFILMPFAEQLVPAFPVATEISVESIQRAQQSSSTSGSCWVDIIKF